MYYCPLRRGQFVVCSALYNLHSNWSKFRECIFGKHLLHFAVPRFQWKFKPTCWKYVCWQNGPISWVQNSSRVTSNQKPLFTLANWSYTNDGISPKFLLWNQKIKVSFVTIWVAAEPGWKPLNRNMLTEKCQDHEEILCSDSQEAQKVKQKVVTCSCDSITFPFSSEHARDTKTGDLDAKTIKSQHAILNSPGNLKRNTTGCAISERTRTESSYISERQKGRFCNGNCFR